MPGGEPLAEGFEGGRKDEDIHEGGADLRIVARSEQCRALGIEVHDDILAEAQPGEDFALERAIAAAMHRGVFQESAFAQGLGELGLGEKEIIAPMFLARTLRTGGAGDGIVEGFCLADGLGGGR